MTIAPFGFVDNSPVVPADAAVMENLVQYLGGYVDSRVAVGSVGNVINLGNITGLVVCDLSQGICFTGTLTGNVTIGFTNWPATPNLTEPLVKLTQDATGGHTITFTAVQWAPNANLPVFQTTPNALTVVSLFSTDQGTTVYGYNPSASRQQVRDSARGLGGQTWELTGASPGATATATSQTLYGTLAGFTYGDVIHSIVVCLQTAAVGAAPTDVRVAVFAKNGNQLAASANVGGSGWTSTGYVSKPLATPYVVPSDTALYLAFWKNGVWPTEPIFAVGNDASAAYAVGSVNFNFLPAVAQTAQATLPSPATLVADTQNMWFGWL